MLMDILVVGGTRFMGKHLVSALIAQGHNVTIATRGVTSDTFGNAINRLTINRQDGESIRSAIAGKQYDMVYDTIAFCSNDVKALLDNVSCGRYVTISTTAVYNKHIDTKENDFNPLLHPLKWCNRPDFPYAEIKRQAEAALFQHYPNVNAVAVRFPFVIGTDDYTKRLHFYVDHIVNQKPMHVDNFNNGMTFVRSDEAGKFLACLTHNDFLGTINGASEGVISIKDIDEYIHSRAGKSAIIAADGDPAPYNGEGEYSINTDKAQALGFQFTPLKSWIYSLLDSYCG